jgi:tRNA threonylcarbamoyladenosine biosynthesis protein TsaB
VSLATEEKVLGEIITYVKKNHSVRLMPSIEQLLKDTGIKPVDLDRIIVAEGPGSYTGVRIGVTVAKTLAWSLNIPIVGVSSLKVLAANGKFFSGVIVPLFDARRGQVYTGLYEYAQQDLTCIEEDKIVLLEEWLMKLKERNNPVLFVGNDVSIHKEVIKEKLGELAFFTSVSQQNARPAELAAIGMISEGQSAHSLVPNYIKMAEAEEKWLASQQD